MVRLGEGCERLRNDEDLHSGRSAAGETVGGECAGNPLFLSPGPSGR